MFVNELAYHTGMFGIYGKSINYTGGYYGIGILSRYPILRYERVLLPNDGKTEQRSMLIADIELPNGTVITFVNTHLEVKTAQMRIEQVQFINEYLKDCPNHLFLAGDMNAIPDTEEMEMLRQGWSDITDRVFTYSTSKPQIKIDYIYTKPSENVELLGTEVQEDIKLSDHFPVISTIVLH
jgi:endonuclease/exonuclease/phosphatase family metal-dependent hydrolase